MKKAIVFGATGLVGSQLVKLLIEDTNYDKIVLFNRRPMSFTSPKIEEHIVNFDQLEDFSDKIDGKTVFCTLGTTIKKAKSIENFRKVDYDMPLQIGKIAQAKKVSNFLIVSSIGANSKSRNYYTKTKGEVEEELRQLNFENFVVLRPSLLLGLRKEFRFLESLSKILVHILGVLFLGSLKKYKAIHSADVARAMIKLSFQKSDKTIYESDEIKQIAKK